MKKFLLILASSLLMASAHAQTIDISKLTPDQQAALQKSAASMAPGAAVEVKNISATAREETEKWAELGGNMGKAAVGAAREIGMAANEFVSTPLGKITMGVVVYKVIGKEIVRTVIGLGLLIFFFTMAVVMFRSKKYKHAEYEYKPTLFGLYNKRLIKSATIDDDWAVGFTVCGFALVIIGLIVGLSVMF